MSEDNHVNWQNIAKNVLSTNDTILTVSLAEALRSEIAAGRLAPGARLPSTRALATLLGVSTVTVATAFSALISEGHLLAHVGRGTFVRASSPNSTSPSLPAIASASIGDEDPTTDQAIWLPPGRPGERQNIISRWMATIDPSTGINLIGGYGDYCLAPAQGYLAMLKRILQREPQIALDFSPSTGHPEARQIAARLVASQFDIDAAEESVFVGASSHGFFDLVLRAFLHPGDVVACESPTYYGALDLLALAGARTVTIPSDENGIRPDGLERVLKAHQPKLVYLTSCANQPTGSMWTRERRDAVAAVIRKSSAIVVEDGSLVPLAYDDRAHTLKSVDQTGQVIFLCSYSKSLFPALRVAIAACSAPIASRLTKTMQSYTRLQASLPQLAFMRYAATKSFSDDMGAAMSEYAKRRAALSAALTGPGLKFRRPSAGFSLWLELPDGLSGEKLCQRLLQNYIYALPGDIFVDLPNDLPAIRLAFGQTDSRELTKVGARIQREVAALSDRKEPNGSSFPNPV